MKSLPFSLIRLIGRGVFYSLFAISLSSSSLCFAQRPPNDDFENRIPLSGSDLTFGGSTVGATLEWDVPGCFGEPGHGDDCSEQSIWWSWTAQTSSPVIIERIGSAWGKFSADPGALAVYSATTLCEIQLPQFALINLRHYGQYVVFNGEAGKTYSIVLANDSSQRPVYFRLMVTNAPQFRLHPKTQTVSTNTHVLFSASAIGIKPIRYQWQYNDADLPNATNQLLGILNALPSDSGEYRVIATSVTGVSTSAVARLFLSTNEVRPVLTVLSARTNFQFQVTGEQGRLYRLESSYDLSNWFNSPYSGRPVLFNTNATTVFQTVENGGNNFFRLSHYHPVNELCNLNLRQIRFAILQFGEDYNRQADDAITHDHILPYLIDQTGPRCPLPDGYSFTADYGMAAISDHPTCNVGSGYGHMLEEEP